jgi:hypothetical protein
LSWTPDIPAALLILFLCVAMFAREIRNWWYGRRYFSAERKKLENVSEWWQSREVER